MKYYHFMWAIISKGLYPNKIIRTAAFCGTHGIANLLSIPQFLTNTTSINFEGSHVPR